MNPMKISMKANINNIIIVKLTKEGEDVLKDNGGSTWQYSYNKKTRVLKVTLWHFARIFGTSLYCGQQPPLFVKNEIVIFDY